ncbi:MAG TPA: DUF4097 family beta strand repeat-containing protein [Euzebyales bacterium]
MPTFDTPTPISVTVDLGFGNVVIAAGDRDTTVVEVVPSDVSNDEDRSAAEKTRVERTDDGLLVRAPKLRSWLSRSGGGSVDVTIALPAGSHVHGALGSADVSATGHLGDCRIKTGLGNLRLETAETVHLRSGSGDITVARVTGRTDVLTGSGDVRLDELGAGAVVKNSNGDTWIGVTAGDLRVRAANGDIDVDRAHADVAATSANGNISVRDVTRGLVVLETQVGDLDVGIREGTAAWLDVSAKAGRVHNTLEATDGPDNADDTVKVRARTTMGQITIRRAQGATDAQ